MNAAVTIRPITNLLTLTASETRIGIVEDLARTTLPGDLWIVNDAATFPASLTGLAESGHAIELRLLPHSPKVGRRWSGVVFGSGDWRTKTEDRPPPPHLEIGDRLRFPGLTAIVRGKDARSPRLIECEFAGSLAEVWAAIYRAGKPVQYAHFPAPLAIWSVQTPYAARPWASEMPSAGRPLHWKIIAALRRAGAEVGSLTHATGLSSTGDAELDARLPFPEFYEIPKETVNAIDRAKARGSRVIAVGTSVMRALEGAANSSNGLHPGFGETDLKIGPEFRRRVVDGILTGMHSAGESHFALLQSFFDRARFANAEIVAESAGFVSHEFGDVSFLIPG